MAENQYLDDDSDNEKGQEEGASTKNRITLILLIAVGVLLVALSVTGTLLAVQLMKPEPMAADASATDAAAVVESGEAGTEEPGVEEGADPALAEASTEGEEQAEPKKPAIYYPIQPPIIVNFDARGRQRFLQAELALMTRDQDVISAIELHMSMIRNSLILLIGSHLFEELQTAEGKEILRQQCLQEVQRLMEQEIGKPGIEQVLFTNFVMQ